jgi:hypothetical protein
MNEGLDQIRSLLDNIEKVGASGVQVAQVGQALADMATSLSAVAQAQERPPTWVTDLVSAIRSLKENEAEDDDEEGQSPSWVPDLMAAIRSVQIINNVQPSEVSFQPSSSPAAQMPLMPSGVRMRVVKRDDLGRLSELVFIPEN